MLKEEIITNLKKTKESSYDLLNLKNETINQILKDLAMELKLNSEKILIENQKDLNNFLKNNDKKNAMYDRLLLNEKRIDNIIKQIIEISESNFNFDNNIIESKLMPSGINLNKITVPFGVIAVIYESRPNVTIDVFALCFKSQNGCILKGGKEAEYTNNILVEIIKNTLIKKNINENIINIVHCSREDTTVILSSNRYVDLCIPRGGKNLIEFVKNNATVPILETGAGVVHAYFSKFADIEIGKKVIKNSKTRRVSVCNALDCLLINKDRLNDLYELILPLQEEKVLLYCDEKAYITLKDKYKYIEKITENEIAKEFLDYKMSIITIENINDAINYINKYTSSHSECIITNNLQEQNDFQNYIDASVIYTNTSTAFTDGNEFGMGAEIGISTQKLHARGPVAIDGLRVIKFFVNSEGAIRKS
jgi:glutamate-5-semialdehyde dehydrogenase